MKITTTFLIILLLLSSRSISGQNTSEDIVYLQEIKNELQKKWPDNKTINIVFHGHSVPSGYFKTPIVNTLKSYPQQFLKALKTKYPFAVVNVITTSIGGENAVTGAKRFKNEVLNHKPDVLFIDYALNDRRIGLDAARKAWEKMIKKAKKKGIKIILMTPSPDLNNNMSESGNELEKHANQIKDLANIYKVGFVDSYTSFQKIYSDCNCLKEYMSQSNHPNEKGHQVIVEEIIKLF